MSPLLLYTGVFLAGVTLFFVVSGILSHRRRRKRAAAKREELMRQFSLPARLIHDQPNSLGGWRPEGGGFGDVRRGGMP
jgi:hypothetical protein